MPDYKSMYFHLAAGVAEAVELLVKAQREGEESYLSDAGGPADKGKIWRVPPKAPPELTTDG